MTNVLNLNLPKTFMGLGAINNIISAVNGLPHSNILIITDPGIANAGLVDLIVGPLKKAGYRFEIYGECESNPLISSIEKLTRRVSKNKFDLLIGIGGGSVMDCAKVISLLAANEGINCRDLINGKRVSKKLAKILIPTTAGTGSEWSSTAMVSDDKADKQKWGITCDEIIPDVAIIDPELTINLPQRITADTGMDALTHAVESYTSCVASIVSDMLALTALKLICGSIGQAYSKGNQNIEARYNMSIGASLAMFAASVSRVGIAHFMGHPLEKRAHITHGAGCTLMLPYAIQFNLIACPEKFAKIAELMGEPVSGLSIFDAAVKSIDAIKRLSRALGMPQTLKEIGIKKTQIPEIVDETINSYGNLIKMWNPRNVSREDISNIYNSALG
jgi:alcohol dehydrogenase class IV